MANDQNEAIAKRAHEIWVESGYPHGIKSIGSRQNGN